MNAFEDLLAVYFHEEGYWVKQSVKVEISKEEKKALGKPSMPRPEIDLVACNVRNKELLAVEAKSYLDSPGVKLEDVSSSNADTHYKLFTNSNLREIIEKNLKNDFLKQGLISEDFVVKYALAAGKICAGDEDGLSKYFATKGWILITPAKIKSVLEKLAIKGYEDDVVTITAKILLRGISKDRLPTSVMCSRDYTKYKLENKSEALAKNRLALAIVMKYVETHPMVDYSALKKAFPDSLHGQAVFSKANDIKDSTRYFMNQPVKLMNSAEVYVSTQWGKGNIEHMIRRAREFGYLIEETE